MLEIVGWLVLLFFLYGGALIIMLWQNALRIRIVDYKKLPIEIWHSKTFPVYVKDILERLNPIVKNLDFRLVAVLKIPNISPNLSDQPCFIFQKNNHLTTFLEAYPPSYELSSNDFTLNYFTLSKDGKFVTSYGFRNWYLKPYLSDELYHNVYHVNPYFLDDAHQEFLQRHGEQAYQKAFDAKSFCQLANHRMVRELDAQLERNQIRPYQNHYRLKFWYALQHANKTKNMRMLKALIGSNALPIPLPRQKFFLEQYLDNENVDLVKSDKLVIFLATLVVSFLLGLVILDWQAIVSLTCVIFLHELGHYLAMKAFGYQKTNIYFLPLLGGFATGNQQKQNMNAETWVLLAGPLPGLVISFIYLFAAKLNYLPSFSSELVHEFLMQMAIINSLNLLPINPFDGGKLFQIVFSGKNVRFGQWLGILISIVAVLVAVFILESFITALIFALPLIYLIKNPKPIEKSYPIELTQNDTQLSILQKLCSLDKTCLNFRQYLEDSGELLKKTNYQSATIINKLLILGILLLNPVVLITCLIILAIS